MATLEFFSVDGLVLSEYPFGIAAMDFADADLTDDGAASQRGGSARYESHDDDAPWTFSVNVYDPTAENLDMVYAAVRAGVQVVIGDAPDRTASCQITVAKPVGIEWPGVSPTFARIMFSGDRLPGWRKNSRTFSLTVTGGNGTVALPAVGGGMAADMDLYATTAGASTYLAVGIKHAPVTGYSPVDGTGSWGSNIALSGTDATLWAGTDRDVTANRGPHIGIATLKHTALSLASSLVYTLRSTILDAIAYSKPVASATTGTDPEVVIFDAVPIPAAPLPANSGGGVIYGAPEVDQVTTVDATPTTGTSTLASVAEGQSLTVGVTGLLSGISLYGTCGTPPDTMTATLYRSGTIIGYVAHYDPDKDGETAKWRELIATSDIPVVAGETLSFTISVGGTIRYKATSIYSGGTRLGYADGDLVFRTHVQPELSFDAKTPITATCSEESDTAAFLSLVRIPSDAGCIVAVGASGAGEGWHYDHATHAVFPANTSSIIGTALDPIRGGIQFAPPPGENMFTVATDGGDVTLSGTITEVSLRRG